MQTIFFYLSDRSQTKPQLFGLLPHSKFRDTFAHFQLTCLSFLCCNTSFKYYAITVINLVKIPMLLSSRSTGLDMQFSAWGWPSAGTRANPRFRNQASIIEQLIKLQTGLFFHMYSSSVAPRRQVSDRRTLGCHRVQCWVLFSSPFTHLTGLIKAYVFSHHCCAEDTHLCCFILMFPLSQLLSLPAFQTSWPSLAQSFADRLFLNPANSSVEQNMTVNLSSKILTETRTALCWWAVVLHQQQFQVRK